MGFFTLGGHFGTQGLPYALAQLSELGWENLCWRPEALGALGPFPALSPQVRASCRLVQPPLSCGSCAVRGLLCCCNAGLSAGCRKRRTHRHCRTRSGGWRGGSEPCLVLCLPPQLSAFGSIHFKPTPSIPKQPAKGTSGTGKFRR